MVNKESGKSKTKVKTTNSRRSKNLEELEIDKLHKSFPHMPTGKRKDASEACIAALEDHKRKSGCTLKVSSDENVKYTLKWTRKFDKSFHQEKTKYLEHGAEAIAFLLCIKHTDFTVIKESPIGTGFDYWLGYDKKHPKYDPENPLLARLEVSGIGQESKGNTVADRVRRKKKQTEISDDSLLPAYIAIVEFFTPKATIVKK